MPDPLYFPRRGPKGTRKLSPREKQIYDLIVTEGLTRGQIAKRLGGASNTISQHVNSIYLKRGVVSAQQLIIRHWKYRERKLMHDLVVKCISDFARNWSPQIECDSTESGGVSSDGGFLQ